MTQAELPSHPLAAREPARAPLERGTLAGTLKHLWPFIWPTDRGDLKMRVVWSVALLLIAKLATLAVPFTFKWATDALTGANTAPVAPSSWKLWLVATPLVMTASDLSNPLQTASAWNIESWELRS